MAASIDGRIVVVGSPDSVRTAVRRQYEEVHASYDSDSWICGRVTMESFVKSARSDEEVAREHTGQHAGGAPREDFHAPGAFAFALDPTGQLG
jgi:2,5-diamino-6-(ribosylamino)-4(3H)-pyrimidinone 5'-phosphate reductase